MEATPPAETTLDVPKPEVVSDVISQKSMQFQSEKSGSSSTQKPTRTSMKKPRVAGTRPKKTADETRASSSRDVKRSSVIKSSSIIKTSESKPSEKKNVEKDAPKVEEFIDPNVEMFTTSGNQ